MTIVSKQELNDMKTLKVPTKNNSEEILVFIEILLKITTTTTAQNITNVHYANALKVFSEPVQTDLPQQPLKSLFDKLDTMHKNIKRAIPNGLFCISFADYQKQTSGIK